MPAGTSEALVIASMASETSGTKKSPRARAVARMVVAVLASRPLAETVATGSSRQEEYISRFDFGSPTRILAERSNHGKRRDPLAALNDEGVVAKTLADRRSTSARVLVSAGQQFKQDYRPVSRECCPCAIKHLALAALDVGFDKTHIDQTEIVKFADLNVISRVIAKLGVRSLQAPGEVENHALIRKRHVQSPATGLVGERHFVDLGVAAQHPAREQGVIRVRLESDDLVGNRCKCVGVDPLV